MTSDPPPSLGERPTLMPPPLDSDADDEWDDAPLVRTTEALILAPVSVPVSNRAALTLLAGLDAGRVFPLENEALIGRAREATIRLEDTGISRLHARVVRTMDGSFLVEDLGSTNGTFVAGAKVVRAPLVSGDHLQLGPVIRFKFAFVDAAEEEVARRLFESSTRDGLTRTYNRKYFHERLAAEVAYSLRHGAPLAAILFDLDHFKAVNDGYGHLVGDDVLRTVANRVTQLIRTEDLFARYGGEEFVLLVRGIPLPNVVAFAERVRRAISSSPIESGGKSLPVTLSLGVSMLDECPEGTGEALVKLADERLYEAKRAGRNCVRTGASSLDPPLSRR